MDNSMTDRLKSIRSSLMDPNNELNLDTLLDSLSAILYESNVKSSMKQKQFESVIKRYLPSVKFIEKTRINISDFTLVKVLGRGAFGEVSLVKDKHTKEIYALKKLKKAAMAKHSEAACLWEERQIMALSDSEWIVKMYFAFQDCIYLYMVMEFMQGGDMVNFMSVYEPNEFNAKFYLAELTLALNFIHEIGFIHRDIKPDNMLLDKNGHLKLCDFGTCLKMGPDGKVRCNIAVGTPDYISPEILNSQNNDAPYGKECDWWSVGVFLYEFLIGETPFYSDSLRETYTKIMSYRTSLKFPSEHDLSKESIDLIRCFIQEPEKRYGSRSIDDIKNHRFFKNQKWKWDNIRSSTPPVIPDVKNPEDTSNFDDLSERLSYDEEDSSDSKSPFCGDHLQYVGFTYSGKETFPSIFGSDVSGETQTSQRNISAIKQEYETTIKELEKSKARIKALESERNNFNNLENSAQSKLKEQISINEKMQENVENIKSELEKTNKALQETKATSSDQVSKITEMEQKIKFYSNELQVLASVKQNDESTISKLKSYEKEWREKVGQLHNAESQIKNLKQSNDHTAEKIKKLNEEKETLHLAFKQAEEIRIKTENECSRLTHELRSIADTQAKYAEETNQLKTSLSKITGDMDFIKGLFECPDIDNLKDKLLASKEQLNQLKSQLELYKAEIEKSELWKKKTEKNEGDELAKAQDRYKVIFSQFADLKTQLTESESRQKCLQEKYSEATSSLQNVMEINSTQSDKIQSLTSQLTSYISLETQFAKEKNILLDIQKDLEDKIEKLNEACNQSERAIIQLKERIQSEEIYFTLHKTQIEDLKEDLKDSEEKVSMLEKNIVNLTQYKDELISNIESKDKLISELQATNRDLDCHINSLAAELTDKSHLQKGFISIEETCYSEINAKLESIKSENESLRNYISQKESQITEYIKQIENYQHESAELNEKISSITQETKKTITQEKMLKEEAIKKLGEIMSNKATSSSSTPPSIRGSSKMKKLEQLLKQLELRLKQDQTQHSKSVKEYEQKVAELKENISALEEENEKMKALLAKQPVTVEKTTSTLDMETALSDADSSYSNANSFGLNNLLDTSEQFIKECFLGTPYKNKKASRKITWIKLLVVLTNKSIYLYKDEDSKEKSSPNLVINLTSIFHVRAVSQNDLIHARSQEISKVFQILYSEEKECPHHSADELSNIKYIFHSGHNLLPIQYHMPTTCDICGKGLWGLIKSSQAMECKVCRFRCHKEHLNEETIPSCKAQDEKLKAKEIFFMASSPKEQSSWIALLIKILTHMTSGLSKPDPAQRRLMKFTSESSARFRSNSLYKE